MKKEKQGYASIKKWQSRNKGTTQTIPALRQKDKLTPEHSRPLGCASVLTLSCFSIETRVYMLTTSVPAVCFPFSILNTDKGKLINENEDCIQPSVLLTQKSLALMWASLCRLIGIYTPSGCVGDVFKDDGCALAYVSVTGRVMNHSGLSNAQHHCYRLSKITMWLHLQSQYIPRNRIVFLKR